MPRIILDMEHCVKQTMNAVTCPYNSESHTPGSGCASDYWCTAVTPRRKTSGYVEWSKDVNPVPSWCPMREDKAEQEKREQEKYIGLDI